MTKKRPFGNVRQLPSKRWQARYRGPDGRLRPAPRTFATKHAAAKWLSVTEVLMLQGDWVDPERGRVLLSAYLEKWIAERAGLRPRTIELYKWLQAKHIDPHIGNVQLSLLAPETVREWRTTLLDAGVSRSVTAKAYRLLRAALNTATEDKRIRENPARIRGAGDEHPESRPVLSVDDVYAIANAMPRRYRVMVLLAAFDSLRWGEVTALQRKDIGPDAATVSVTKSLGVVQGEGLVLGLVKSRAGVRELVIPAVIREDVLAHLEEFTRAGADAYLFTGELGGPLWPSNFNQRIGWVALMKRLGLPGVHFHDLRHAGNIWASKTKTSTRDLMARMGHDDMRAALIYQRATREADQRIADELSALVRQTRR